MRHQSDWQECTVQPIVRRSGTYHLAQTGRLRWFALTIWLATFPAMMGPAATLVLAQYHPEHPKVQAMVDRGLAYLTDNTEPERTPGFDAGGQALVGYAVLKATGDVEHPRVKIGIRAAQQIIRSLATHREMGESKIVYEACMAAIILAEVDYARYQSELDTAKKWLISVQKPHGGFGYLMKDTGDTSQVQYVMLAFWTLQQVGVDVPPDVVESTMRYLRATMDPTGGWGYQGKIANAGLIAQDGVTKSLATAGAGALLIGGDMLGFFGDRTLLEEMNRDDGIPKAFVRTDLRAKIRAERREIDLERSFIEGPINLATRYQAKSRFSGIYWYYYWRYSQERYESFLELFNNEQEKSPDWYNQGVNELANLQEADGCWGNEKKTDYYPADVSTAFSILFLIRSTQKSIGKLDAGVVFGGYGLPQDVTNVRMVGDRIVSDAEVSVENLLTMLEGDEASGVETGLLSEKMQLSDNPEVRGQQVERLSRLLYSGDYKARRIAAKLLGRSEDLDQVPDLIYALSDQDPYVPMIAEESLRLLSRKLTAGSLNVNPSPEERLQAEKFWKQWYLGVRPDYIFLSN